MNIHTETWHKDAFELIDYESEGLNIIDFSVKYEGIMYRNEREHIADYSTYKKVGFYKRLLELKVNNENKFEIIPNPYIDNDLEDKKDNLSWFVFKSSKCPDKGNRYKLTKGDIIKVGRSLLKFRDLKGLKSSVNESNNEKLSSLKENTSFHTISPNVNKAGSEAPLKETENYIKIYGKSTMAGASSKVQKVKTSTLDPNLKKRTKKKKKSSDICRICLETETDEIEDPLIQPCKCSGSLKYIHLKCLKHWLNTNSCKKIQNSEQTSIFAIKNVECEICKQKLPDCLIHNGKPLELIDFFSEFQSYAVFESLNNSFHNDRRENKQKIYFVVELQDDVEIILGRGHEANFVLSDISVSRNHSLLTYEDDSLYIQDNDSKFGTLILVQTPIFNLKENLPLCIQAGRTYFRICLEGGCCLSCVNQKVDVNTYYKQNQKAIKFDNGVEILEEKESDLEEESEKEEGVLVEGRNDKKSDKESQKSLDKQSSNFKVADDKESQKDLNNIKENYKKRHLGRKTVCLDEPIINQLPPELIEATRGNQNGVIPSQSSENSSSSNRINQPEENGGNQNEENDKEDKKEDIMSNGAERTDRREKVVIQRLDNE